MRRQLRFRDNWVRCTVFLLAAAPGLPDNYLLTDAAEIEAARRKTEQRGWARQSLDALLLRAERALDEPLEFPDRGGQWPHWYSCRQDGSGLKTVSPVEHVCPVCQTVYRGDPFDAVILYRVHTRYSQAARDLGLAFRFTGRQEFAERAREILLGYAERYPRYPLHDRFGGAKTGGGRVMAQTLDESVWLIPVVWGYALVKEKLSTGERERVEKDLLLPAAGVIRQHRMGIHNIQCWKNSAVGLVGLATGRKDLVQEAIDDPERGFRVQIERGVTADGLWFEGSLGYHQYTMNALWPLAEAARHAGIDLHSDRYRTLYDAPLALALPNGDSPGFNDSAGANLRAYGPLYEIAYARWRRPEYGRVAANTARESLEALLYGSADAAGGPIVPADSMLLRHAGYAALRSPAVTAAVRFGMHGGGHGHPDKLNLVTFGGGRLAALDPGSINYGVPLHQEWYRSTIAHNTVSVDGGLQRNEDGRLEEWAVEDGVTRLVASAGTVYPVVQLRRLLVLSQEELLDRFECTSETPHTYDWALHVPGSLSSPLSLETQEGALGQTNGYQHIKTSGRAVTGADFSVTWELGGVKLILAMKGAPGTLVFVGDGPGRDPEERVSVLIVRRTAATTTFEATHRFVK